MEKNKTGKYFKYAIGEIVLVVIGILIALSINNWNERQKIHKNIKGIYSIIQSDLIDDIKTIDNVLNSMVRLDSLAQRVLNKEITYDDYKKCEYCVTILDGFPDFKLNKRGINLLNQNLTSFQANQDSLLIKVSKFYSYFNIEIDVALKEVIADYKDNRHYFKNNKTWFEDYDNSVINDEFIKYALESQDYRNRVNSFYTLYFEVYFGHLKQYKKYALMIMEDINKEIK